jgi:hypothetical protein
MGFFEIFLIIIFSIFQSIFGIGLLFIGTPVFLLFGYDFFNVLNILLPHSIAISFLQIITSEKKYFDIKYRFIKYCLPYLLISLFLLIFFEKNINFILLVSFVLIIFSTINLLKSKIKLLTNLSDTKVNYGLVILGIIHGFTNMGGGLLTLISTNMSNKKNIIRYNIASGYLILGITQLFFINFFFMKFDFSYLKYIPISILCFYIAQKLYKKIQDDSFLKILNLFILFYSIYIFVYNLIK